MTRASARQNEVAVRLAVGASRIRVATQLVTESIVIAFLGGALGLLLAGVGIRLIQVLGLPDLPRLDQVCDRPARHSIHGAGIGSHGIAVWQPPRPYGEREWD